ncbi:MAG: hypothetical protein RL264_251 [Bacteroidota bacterium]
MFSATFRELDKKCILKYSFNLYIAIFVYYTIQMFTKITSKELRLTVGSWCKELRKKEGLSQAELADALAVSRLTIAKVERGDNYTVETLFNVLRHFGELNSIHDFVKEKKANLTIESLY